MEAFPESIPWSMQRRWRIQRLVMRTSSYSLFRWAYTTFYAGILLCVLARLRRFREIHAIELKIRSENFCFGSSDLDLWGLIAPLRAPSFLALSDRLAGLLVPSRGWRRIIDLYLLSDVEGELKRQFEPVSLRRLRIMGPSANSKIERPNWADEQLARAMYGFITLSEKLFRGSLQLDHQSIRVICSTLLKIDMEIQDHRQPLSQIDPGMREAIISMASSWARGRPAHDRQVEDALRVLALAQDEVTALSTTSGQPNCHQLDSELSLVEDSIKPETIDAAVNACKTAVARLCSTLAGVVRSAVLGATQAAATTIESTSFSTTIWTWRAELKRSPRCAPSSARPLPAKTFAISGGFFLPSLRFRCGGLLIGGITQRGRSRSSIF